jgi:hypothetical protein
MGRPFGAAVAVRQVADEDWSDFNRIAFWVYPDLPGFRVVSLALVLHNAGEEKVPGSDGRHGRNFVLLKNHEWNQVVWEIAHLGRDRVTGVEIAYRLQGHEPGATDTVRFHLDDLELQRVDADYNEGWEVAPGRIAYCHTGYECEHEKIALASDLDAERFTIVDVRDDRVVFEGVVQRENLSLGRFQAMDFSAMTTPGTYRLKAGDRQTRPFRIGVDVWREPLLATINLFYTERCGTAIPGIHDVCHRDWMCVHEDGRKTLINGGWHDSGDLSQGLINTSEAVYAMLRLAEHLRQTDPQLSKRLREEAQWGLDWVLQGRFGDGARCTWATMDFWTDGILGTVDDVTSRARDRPFENFMAAATEAVAARILRPVDPVRAEACLKAAQADWRFAMAKTEKPGLEVAAAALNASLDLWAASGQESYAEHAVRFAEVVRACQQVEWTDWEVPMRGFFYTSPDRLRILHYLHRGHEQAPVVGLVRLAETLPEHENRANWHRAIQLYADYYRAVVEFTHPWSMIPAAIYREDESGQAGFAEQVRNGVRLHEGIYLRRFPVWFDFRGHYGVLLSQTKGLAVAAQYLEDPDLLQICRRQLEWVLGRNPFGQSTMYGVGYDFAPQYTAMSGDLVGSLPVGIQTKFDRDAPYWPAENCYNWKEVWVHPSARWLWLMADLY